MPRKKEPTKKPNLKYPIEAIQKEIALLERRLFSKSNSTLTASETRRVDSLAYALSLLRAAQRGKAK